MAVRIEIARMWNGKLEVRIGDLSGSTEHSNLTKKEVLTTISYDIDKLNSMKGKGIFEEKEEKITKKFDKDCNLDFPSKDTEVEEKAL